MGLCVFLIKKSEISDNTSKKGGAIYNDVSGTLTIEKSALERNTADENGGAVWLAEFEGFDPNDSTFKDNIPNDIYDEKLSSPIK